jgi:hypothetical protein
MTWLTIDASFLAQSMMIESLLVLPQIPGIGEASEIALRSAGITTSYQVIGRYPSYVPPSFEQRISRLTMTTPAHILVLPSLFMSPLT